jgi:hypothetical protein
MDITSCISSTASIVQLSGVPSSTGYVLGARLVRKQGLDRVKALMAVPSSLEAALTAVKDKVCSRLCWLLALCCLLLLPSL